LKTSWLAWVKTSWLAWVIVIGLLGATVFVVASWDKPLTNMQTQATRQSLAYITTHQSALRQFRTSYEAAASPGQRNAIVAQMRAEADLIPGNVPSDIQEFLRRQP
jgi:hypothetical protein